MNKLSIEDCTDKFIHGDFFKIADFLPERSFDCCITDFPYGIDYQSNMRKDKLEKIEGDTHFGKFQLEKATGAIARLLKKNTHFYSFCRWDIVGDFMKHTNKFFTPKSALAIPSASRGGMGDLKGSFAPSYEMCLFFQKGYRPFNETRIKRKSDGSGYVSRFSDFIDWLPVSWKSENFRVHPNQKSLEIVAFFILLSTNEGDIILDPFCGSGIVAIAANMLGRHFLCIDKSKVYFPKAVELYKSYKAGLLDDIVSDSLAKLNVVKRKEVSLENF